MKVFTIQNETNNIAIHTTVQEASGLANATRFRSEASFTRLAAVWPTSRLIKIWNGLPGVNRVIRFRDRATAVSRIWKAIQVLPELDIARGSAKVKKTPGSATNAVTPRKSSKASQVIAMLRRADGTSLEEIMRATGWQKHTTRAILSAGGSLIKTYGLAVTSARFGETRRYYIKG